MATSKKNKTNHDNLFSEGKVPPHFYDLEKKVLSIMMMKAAYIVKVKDILKPQDFYVDAHKITCEAIYALTEKNMVADLEAVVQYLREKGKLDFVGGAYGLAVLSNNVVSSANTIAFCYKIKGASVKRTLLDFSAECFGRCYDDAEDVSGLLADAGDILRGMNKELSEMDEIDVAEVAMNYLKKRATKIYNERNDIHDPNRIRTQFREWDEINGDLYPGVYVVAGRPGMGKGIHMTEMICRTAHETPVGVLSGEMTTEQLLIRLGCNLKGYSNELYEKHGKVLTDIEDEMIQDAFNEAVNLKMKVYEGKRIDKVANKIKMWVEGHGVKIIFADYLTLFKVPEHMEKHFINDTQRVNMVYEVFVDIAKEIRVPIILYCQMNREILGRSGLKEPTLSDLKNSGNIEEGAFQVAFLHRPEYFDNPTDDNEGIGIHEEGLTWFIIAKHRGGKVGRFKLKADLAKSKMNDWFGQDYYKRPDSKEFFTGKIPDAEIVNDDDDDDNNHPRGLPYKD